MTKNCLVLLSGGLDSVTTIAKCLYDGYDCHAISFKYGQRHSCEIEYAEYNAKLYAKTHKIFDMSKVFADFNSSLINNELDGIVDDKFPKTYVPARNMIFLSIATGYAESIGCSEIFIGANAIDYSGYPDCRPEFIDAFQKMANLGTSFDDKFSINAPLINMEKVQIIELGLKLGVDYSKTISCYFPKNNHPCLVCDSCKIREDAFAKIL
jgi:7-cyano-7-deazaguanine synthase